MLLDKTNNALKDKLFFCLGELHAVFAHVRAIGALINGSGKAWQVAGWFDNSVIECNHFFISLS